MPAAGRVTLVMSALVQAMFVLLVALDSSVTVLSASACGAPFQLPPGGLGAVRVTCAFKATTETGFRVKVTCVVISALVTLQRIFLSRGRH